MLGRLVRYVGWVVALHLVPALTALTAATRVTCGVHLGAVLRVVLDERELRQLDVLVHHERYVRVPLEYHVVRRV